MSEPMSEQEFTALGDAIAGGMRTDEVQKAARACIAASDAINEMLEAMTARMPENASEPTEEIKIFDPVFIDIFMEISKQLFSLTLIDKQQDRLV